MGTITTTAQAGAVVLTAAVLLAATWRAPWASLLRPERTHWFCACIVCIVVLRSMDAMPIDGLRLHLLGTTLLYVLFGVRLALLAEGIAGAAICMAGEEAVSEYAFNFLFRGALPIAVAWSIFRTLPTHGPIAARFPGRIAAAFLAGACASLLVMGISVLSSGPVVRAQIASSEVMAMLVLLTSAEAQLCLIGTAALLACGHSRGREVARMR